MVLVLNAKQRNGVTELTLGIGVLNVQIPLSNANFAKAIDHVGAVPSFSEYERVLVNKISRMRETRETLLAVAQWDLKMRQNGISDPTWSTSARNPLNPKFFRLSHFTALKNEGFLECKGRTMATVWRMTPEGRTAVRVWMDLNEGRAHWR